MNIYITMSSMALTVLVESFRKAHQTISLKHNETSEKGEWGGSYSYKYDGMHFGLKTSFIKALTNK